MNLLPFFLRGFAASRESKSGFTRSREAAKKVGVLLAMALSVIWMPAALNADSLLPKAHWADTQLPDPEQESAAKALMLSIRCLVCQGQSIADSDAELAGDMRALIRERIKAGEKPAAIRAWLVERYGEWVSYDPPFSAVTAPLWIAPILLLGAGIWLARGRLRRKR